MGFDIAGLITAIAALLAAVSGHFVGARNARVKDREIFRTELHEEITRLREDLASRDEANARLLEEVQELHKTVLNREVEIAELKQLLILAQGQIDQLTQDIALLTKGMK